MDGWIVVASNVVRFVAVKARRNNIREIILLSAINLWNTHEKLTKKTDEAPKSIVLKSYPEGNVKIIFL